MRLPETTYECRIETYLQIDHNLLKALSDYRKTLGDHKHAHDDDEFEVLDCAACQQIPNDAYKLKCMYQDRQKALRALRREYRKKVELDTLSEMSALDSGAL